MIERDVDWLIGLCPLVPGANEQGRSADEFRANLAAAMILDDRLSFLPMGPPS